MVETSMVFLGHTYQVDTHNRIDFRLRDVRFDGFDFVLLGGDLCGIGSGSLKTLHYLDSIFDLQSEFTFWAVGNHDLRGEYSSEIPTITGKPLWSEMDFDNLRIVVLNTNLTIEDCTSLNAQFDILQNALSDLNHIETIILLSHHAIWTDYVISLGEPYTANARHGQWKVHCRSTDNTFENSILPLLEMAGHHGVNIYWISGDYGQKVSAYEFRVNDHLTFIGNGLDAYKLPRTDSILMMKWLPSENVLQRLFVPIDNFASTYR